MTKPLAVHKQQGDEQSLDRKDSIRHGMRSRKHALTRPSPVPIALLVIDVLTTFRFPDGDAILKSALAMRDALVSSRTRAP